MGEHLNDTNGEPEDTIIDYRIAPTVLEKIVRGALLTSPTIRLPHGVSRASRHPVEVAVEGGECQVKIHVLAPLGEDLLALGSWIRAHVGGKLASMTGMTVSRLDVHIDGVYPPDASDS